MNNKYVRHRSVRPSDINACRTYYIDNDSLEESTYILVVTCPRNLKIYKNIILMVKYTTIFILKL